MRYQRRCSSTPEPSEIQALASIAIAAACGAILLLILSFAASGVLTVLREVCGCK